MKNLAVSLRYGYGDGVVLATLLLFVRSVKERLLAYRFSLNPKSMSASSPFVTRRWVLSHGLTCAKICKPRCCSWRWTQSRQSLTRYLAHRCPSSETSCQPSASIASTAGSNWYSFAGTLDLAHCSSIPVSRAQTTTMALFAEWNLWECRNSKRILASS